jgi:predicted ATPase/DNA-binding CsgD family transcriptional regulator/DNA-binding XRE family transcriptional regulator
VDRAHQSVLVASSAPHTNHTPDHTARPWGRWPTSGATASMAPTSSRCGATLSFADTLREHRRTRGWTQAQLAEKADLSERAISDLERALKRPQRATMRLLGNALGLTAVERQHLESLARSAQVSLESIEGPARHNLPATFTSFVGREQAISDLRRKLGRSQRDPEGPRLVTLTGTGGCGKTRLALEVAKHSVDSFRDGVRFVDLAPVSDERLLPYTLLAGLGVTESPGTRPVEMLLRLFAHREVLLVLDNCEHLVQGCAELFEALLPATTHLRVLATSRELLRIPGEIAWRVQPLPVPVAQQRLSVDEIERSPAVRLFVDRARAVDGDFELTPENADAVALICEQLDGLPLAIELAAARANVLTVEQMVDRLADRFGWLVPGARTATPRHQTLRACVDWSYDLLSQPERRLLRALSVFAGGWTLETAETVCKQEDLDGRAVLDVLAGLVDKSLVQRAETGECARFRLLETIRQYARDRLRSAGEEAAWQHRLARWTLRLLEQAAPCLVGAEQANWLEHIEFERDNFRAALDWCSRHNGASSEFGLSILDLLGHVWFKRQQQTEARRWIERILSADRGPARPVRVRVLNWGAEFATHQGDLRGSDELAERALEEAKELGYTAGRAVALSRLGTNADTRGAHDRGVALLEEGLRSALQSGDPFAIYYARHKLAEARRVDQKVQAAGQLILDNFRLAERCGDEWGIAEALRQLALVAEAGEEYDNAAELLEQSLAKWREIGAARGPHWALLDLGRVSLARGELERARKLIGQSLRMNRDAWNRRQLAMCLQALAAVAAEAGQPRRAAILFGAAERLGAQVAVPSPGGDRTTYARGLAAAKDQLGDDEFADAWSFGNALSLDQALNAAEETATAEARSTAGADAELGARRGHIRSSRSLTARLTVRQAEVLRLVTEGKTNRQIAAKLMLSHKTVGRHLENIFATLAVSSRAAATRIAVREALIGEPPIR